MAIPPARHAAKWSAGGAAVTANKPAGQQGLPTVGRVSHARRKSGEL